MKYVYFVSYFAEKDNKMVFGTCEYISSVKLNSWSRRIGCANQIALDAGFAENSVKIFNCEFARHKFFFSKSS